MGANTAGGVGDEVGDCWLRFVRSIGKKVETLRGRFNGLSSMTSHNYSTKNLANVQMCPFLMINRIMRE